MKIEGYSSTPGLDRYPQNQRLATWRLAHKELVRTNAPYRNRYHSYLVGVTCPASVLLLPLLFAASPLSIVLSVLAVLGGAIALLAFAQQRYMNREIGRFLSLRTSEPQSA